MGRSASHPHGRRFFLGAGYLTLELVCAAASVPLFPLRSAAYRLGSGAVLFSQVIEQLWTGWRTTFPRDMVPKGAKLPAWPSMRRMPNSTGLKKAILCQVSER
jgi:hypothetical protein